MANTQMDRVSVADMSSWTVVGVVEVGEEPNGPARVEVGEAR